MPLKASTPFEKVVPLPPPPRDSLFWVIALRDCIFSSKDHLIPSATQSRSQRTCGLPRHSGFSLRAGLFRSFQYFPFCCCWRLPEKSPGSPRPPRPPLLALFLSCRVQASRAEVLTCLFFFQCTQFRKSPPISNLMLPQSCFFPITPKFILIVYFCPLGQGTGKRGLLRRLGPPRFFFSSLSWLPVGLFYSSSGRRSFSLVGAAPKRKADVPPCSSSPFSLFMNGASAAHCLKASFLRNLIVEPPQLSSSISSNTSSYSPP